MGKNFIDLPVLFHKYSIRKIIITLFLMVYILTAVLIFIIVSRNISAHVENMLSNAAFELNNSIDANIRFYLLSIEDKVRNIETTTSLLSIAGDSSISDSKKKREIAHYRYPHAHDRRT